MPKPLFWVLLIPKTLILGIFVFKIKRIFLNRQKNRCRQADIAYARANLSTVN